MSVADQAFSDAPPRWIEFFEASPVQALDELFTNSFYHDSLNMTEPEELLLDWAAAIDSASFNEMLDSAIATWIELRWNKPSKSGESLGLMWQRAFRVTATADSVLHKAITTLFSKRTSAVSYLGPLVQNRATDPLGWYWASISRVQADDSLVWQWFRLCNLVPGTPAFHGQWGLLGLQRAPGDDRGGFRTRAAAGLEQYLKALHTQMEEQRIGQREADRLALQATQGLKRRYPFPNRWREYWSTHNSDLPLKVQRWVIATWDERIFRLPASAQRRQWNRHAEEEATKWPARATTVAERLRKSFSGNVRKEAEALLKSQRSYALDTGNSYYIVRTLCRFSTIILDRDKRSAISWAEEAITWEPWNPYCWTTVIAATKASGDLEKAMRLSFEAIDRFPDDPVARNGLAEVLRQAGRLDEAETAYQETISRFPDNQYARTGLAEVLRQAGRLDEAQTAYQEAVSRFPDNPVACTGLAELLRQAGRLDEAETAYQETISRFPDNPVACTGLAEVLRQAGRLDEAETAYQETISRFPDDPVARNGLAEVLRQAGRLDEAETAYQETISRFPDNQYARTGLAAVLRQAGRLDEAETAYQETISRFPDNPSAQNALASIQRSLAQEGEPATLPDDVEESAGDGTPDAGDSVSAAQEAGRVTTSSDKAGSTETGLPVRSAEDFEPSPTALRADIQHALLLKGKERLAALQRVVRQADHALSINPSNVDALYTKAEAFLALRNYESIEGLLASLPGYIIDRPDFLALKARLETARLMLKRPQPFDSSVVESIADSWITAGKSSVELRGAAILARLRASSAMVDGAALRELQESATANFARITSEQSGLQRGYAKSSLGSWWLTTVRHAVMGGASAEEVSYEEVAPQLDQYAPLLDALDGELVSASRYTYAPK